MNEDSYRLVGLSVYHCVNDASLALFTSALPVMRISLGLSFLEIGTVLSAGLAATMVFQVLVGQLTDIGHARTLLFVGFAAIVVTDLLFPASSTFLQVLIFYVLLRSAAGVYHPVSYSSIGRMYIKNKTAAFGYQGAIGDLGLALATLSTGIMSQAWGWEIPFWAWGAIGMALFAYFTATVIKHNVMFFSRLVSPVSEIADLSKSKSVWSTFALIAIASSLTTATFIVFTGYMPLFFNVARALTPAESTAIVAAWIGIGAVAQLATGRISDRLGGEVRTLQLMFAIEAALLAVALYVLEISAIQLVGYFAIILTGIPVFIAFPVVNSLLGLRMPHRRLGLTYGITLSLGLLVASGTTYLTGYLASTMSISVALPVLLVVAAVAAVTSLLL